VAKRRGRPAETLKAQANADAVFVALARDRSLAKLPAKLGPDNVKNPLSGESARGQAYSPRAFHKQVLPEIAARLGISPRTLERHCLEHGEGALTRVVKEITARLRRRDADRKEQIEFLARKLTAAICRGDTDGMLAIAGQIARIRQGEEVFRKK
jgi:AraC-like DNA-binding protein